MAGRDSAVPPIRFLHAAGLDPDAHLADLPPSLADLAGTAAADAFERLVTQAIERQVDFLLLTPAVPIDGLPDGPSLSGEAAIRDQFDRLADEGVPVFLAVGSRSSGWERLAGRDSHAVLLQLGAFAPVASRGGRTAGVLRCVDRPTVADRATSPARTDETIDFAVAPGLSARSLDGVTTIAHDYLALGTGRRQTVSHSSGAAHAPGMLQATDATESGPHGASLVTIDDTGKVTTEFVSTAAVRFERLTIEAEPQEQPDDLLLRIAERVSAMRTEPGEQAWVVRWTIEAAGSLYETLSDPSRRAELLSVLPEALGDVPLLHRVIAVPHPLWPALDDPFAAEFAAALAEEQGHRPALAVRLDPPGDMPQRGRLARLLAKADPAAVLGVARRFGLHVTAAAAEE